MKSHPILSVTQPPQGENHKQALSVGQSHLSGSKFEASGDGRKDRLHGLKLCSWGAECELKPKRRTAMGKQEQPPLAHPAPLTTCPEVRRAAPANQGQCALTDATRWADGPQKGRQSVEKPDLEVTVTAREQTHGGPYQMETPEGRDISRQVSLWASVSLEAQQEQKWVGAHPPAGTQASCLRPQSTRQERVRGWGAGSRSAGRPPSPCWDCTGLLLGDGNGTCFTDAL